MHTLTATHRRTAWSYFPYAMAGALGFVVVVNIGMVWSAVQTFPGVAALDVFDYSNSYDTVLAQAAREAALGWTVRPVGEAASQALVLRDNGDRPLTGATVTAQARRPVGPDMLTPLVFSEDVPGHYAATQPLPAPGQWELRVTIVQAGQTLHATRRIVTK